MSKFVPYATRKRLPLYYKTLQTLQKNKVEAITSTDLAHLLKIDSTTIRRDFSAIGRLGKKGTGYNIELMLKIFEEEFDLNRVEKVVIIGYGHLGKAVAAYFSGEHNVAKVIQVYDINNDVIGEKINNLVVEDYANINETLDPDTRIAILTLPGVHAQETLNNLIKLGIKAFVNFTGTKVFTQQDRIIITDIDISQVMQSLVYDLRSDY
jgi:redox-sensing transcriptional repressor